MAYQAPHSGIRLLIVDDDRSIRALVRRIAEGWGYETEECPSAEDALKLLEQRKFNIILSDIRMGKLDGIAFAEIIREKMPSTAVAIMTGSPSVKTAQRSQNMGAIYYLQKPISTEELGDTLKIAASWNIGMLIDRASKRYLALRKGHERDLEKRLGAIKDTIRRILMGPGWVGHLRDFVYSSKSESNPLFEELNRRFSANSVKPF